MMKCPSCVLRVLIEFAGVPIIVSTVAATGPARRAGTGKDSGSFIGSFTPPFPGRFFRVPVQLQVYYLGFS